MLSDSAEVPVAFITIKGSVNQHDIVKQIIELCKKELEAEQVPVDIRIIDKFPVKPSGKRDMEQLKKLAQV